MTTNHKKLLHTSYRSNQIWTMINTKLNFNNFSLWFYVIITDLANTCKWRVQKSYLFVNNINRVVRLSVVITFCIIWHDFSFQQIILSRYFAVFILLVTSSMTVFLGRICKKILARGYEVKYNNLITSIF